MFWLLFGAFLYLLIKNQFDMQGVKKDARKIAKYIMNALRNAGKTIHSAAEQAKMQKSAPAQPAPEPEVRAVAVSPETQENNELLKDLEQNTGIASILANVPVLNFPEDDPKYDSSRKYNYA